MLKLPAKNAGFVMKLMLFVVAACVLFIVFATLIKYLGPEGQSALGGGNPGLSATGSGTGGNNPLLSVLNTSGGGNPYSGSGSSSNIPAADRSPYAGKIVLGGGNAASSYQPFEEYVTLDNIGNASVNVTGWTLSNGKGSRPLQNSGNNYFYASPDMAMIGEGTEFLDPTGTFRTGPISLAPGDNAIVTTGRPFSQFPFSINTSFRENICEGYLKNYPFEPSLSLECPLASDDSAVRYITSECYDYVQSLSRCEDPQKYDKDNFDLETTQCRSFMTARLNYPSCVAAHRGDSGFSLKEWRIFLSKNKELWADRRETITLYDANGLIVDQISY